MADSDDEYDRRRGRDKFRRERSDYQDRREERGRRDDWPERNRESWGRDRGRRDNYNRDYDSRRRDRYSPMRHDMSPPQAKRMRRDMEDVGYGGYDVNYGGGPMHPPPGWVPPPDLPGMGPLPPYGTPGQQRDIEAGTVQPPMMTFKQFLASQEDTIDDQEAVRKYNDYKLDFKKKQLNKFFMTHKEEEWFKVRYHPEECLKREAEVLKSLKHRLNVFMELIEKNKLDSLSIDLDKQDEIIKLLDSVVIKLEGGTEFDLKVLDEPVEPEKKEEPAVKEENQSETRSQEGDKKDSEKQASNGQMNMSSEQKELQRQAQEYLAQKQQTEVTEPPPVPSPPKEEKRRKRHREYSYDENDESATESDSGSEPAPPGVDNSDPQPPAGDGVETQSNNTLEDMHIESAPEEADEPEEPVKEVVVDENNKSTEKLEGEVEEEKEEGEEKDDEKEKEETKKEVIPTPCPLHKTSSIFLRNLAPAITKQEVEAMCKRYPGYLRVAIADPQPERRFFRRGWVTFDRTVNIKEICWNLNNIRLRDCELGAIVNRDLSRRIRSIPGVIACKQIVKNDLKLAAKIIQNYDNKHKLWDDENKDSDKQNYGLMSRNPILRNVTDYLIEEASAEEEELLGTAITQEEKPKETNPEVSMERDETLIKVLDRLLLYLRIVYSIDYYNASDYPNEDEMPNRCGIMHSRGPCPPNRVTQNDVNECINNFEHKLQPFLMQEDKLSDAEALTLGKKDHKVEVEKFVASNTQELAKDKWLCPLSGKKFKGPEYVRKHIFNKHCEKIEEVKKEVEYFNNYLYDPKRPQLPEHQPPLKIGPMGGRDSFDGPGGFAPGGQPHPLGSGYSGQPRPPMMGYQGGSQKDRPYNRGPGFNFPQYQRGGNYEMYRSHSFPKLRGRGGRDPREIIQYRDLDAPDDMDIF